MGVTCYNPSVVATGSLYLHNLAASQMVGYTGHPLSKCWKLTPPTQWLAEPLAGAAMLIGSIILVLGIRQLGFALLIMSNPDDPDVKSLGE